MDKQFYKLSPEHFEIFKKNFHPAEISFSYDFVYESQIPNSAFILLSGTVELYRKNKKVGELEPGWMVGLNHILQEAPVTNTCKIKAGSHILVVEKSTILNILNNDHILTDIISELSKQKMTSKA
jgi:CRP-like cAMP-binding protein